MNTERPDHDDTATPEAEAAGAAEDAAARPEAPEPEVPPVSATGDGGGDDHGEGGDDGRGGGEGDRGDDGQGGDEGDGGDSDSDGGGRFGRGRSPLVAASVAAAVLLVGGGGAYLATSAHDGSGDRTGSAASRGHGTPPPLVLDDYASGRPGDTGATAGTSGIAPGEPNPYGATYRAAGTLPAGPASAPVYEPRGEVTRDEVARLAKALGVEGTVVADAQAWRVGTGKDGAGPMLRVNRQAPGTWTFSRYAPGTDDCKGAVCTHDPAAPAAHPVSVATAEKAAAPVLKALGQDDAKVDASQVMGAQRVVNADPRFGGLPAYGWTTGLTVSPQGEVVGGSGQVKAPVKGETYPVLSARRTLDLMNAAPRTDHRMGIGGCASPVPLKDRLEAPCGSSGNSGSSGSSTASGLSGRSAGQDAFAVDRAVFGLASHSSNGRQTLVPSWLFQVRGASGQDGDGFTVTYPAVDPEYLSSPGAPSGRPEPRPSGSGAAPATRDVRVSGYSTEGDELTVSFEGGVCADYRTSAKESSDRVTVTVTETPWPDKVCILIAKEYRQSVHLDRPLGDRKVVGSDGSRIPRVKPGARLPAPPRAAGQPVR
ncbi:hypothetical protein [Streptomyces sp. MK7]|uniref:hypothetical protein n=1 Tax=Streptomyces sp. MK7 TaxID=3067635 RepID=UPI00292D0E6B|nr:hypothetical protein [Streptomyces sp. MK7]